MSAPVISPGFHDLVDVGVAPEKIATGFFFTEGPIWMKDGSLHFSDIPNDVRRRWHPTEGLSTVRQPSNKCNGMTLDNDGHLVVCEHSTSRVIRETGAGQVQIVASHYRGKELNSPNDVIVASDNSVIFTDPEWGRTVAAVGRERPLELPFRGVFRVPANGGEPQLLVDDFAGPNGLCFSPDEKLLYINDSLRAHIRVFDVGPDFELSNGRVFASGIGAGVLGQPTVDGMKVDELGNVYVTGPGGIWIFTATGERLGVLAFPEDVNNFNWGGDEWTTLFVAAATSIFRIELRVSGNLLPYMRRG